MILVGDLNVAPLEHDVWSHKQMIRVVSHTPIECEKLVDVQKTGGWVDAMRMHVPEPDQALHLVELPLARLGNRRQGAAASTISGLAPALADRVADIKVAQEFTRLDAALGPRAGDGDVGSVINRANHFGSRASNAARTLWISRVD